MVAVIRMELGGRIGDMVVRRKFDVPVPSETKLKGNSNSNFGVTSG